MDDTEQQEPSSIKRSFIINSEDDPKYEPKDAQKSGKGVLLIIGLLAILLIGGFFLNQKFRILPGSGSSQPEPSPLPSPSPSPSPEPILNRSEWSFEVLNGSGVTGQAKKIADQIKALGYPVVKTGNADKSNYADSQILAKEELLDGGASGTKIDLVIADLKDIIKIASVAGELTEGTASARIIIGKDVI
ncbi:MAG: LytR C-terminal domain-containing protein [bacterium]|nr:LytR C-terminal domain-containing protein [bacterium]